MNVRALAQNAVRRRARRVRTGLGLYNYDLTEVNNIGAESNWEWAGEAFGDVGTDALREQVYRLIVAKADDLVNAGALDQQGHDWMVRGAAAGSFVYPALTSAMGADAMVKTAWYKMMEDTGLWAARQQVRSLVKKAVLKEARALAANEAFWNAIAVPLEYVSGAKAIDKLNELIANIRSEVGATKDLLAQARETLPDDMYAEVAAEAKGIDAEIALLQRWVPGVDADTGTTGLGWVQAAIAIAVGAAIGIAAICWAYVQAKKVGVANKLAEMTDKQREAEIAAAQANPNLSPEQKQVAIIAAGDRAAQGQAKVQQLATAAGAEGLFGINFKWVAIAGVALVGLMVLPQVLAAFPRKSAAT